MNFLLLKNLNYKKAVKKPKLYKKYHHIQCKLPKSKPPEIQIPTNPTLPDIFSGYEVVQLLDSLHW